MRRPSTPRSVVNHWFKETAGLIKDMGKKLPADDAALMEERYDDLRSNVLTMVAEAAPADIRFLENMATLEPDQITRNLAKYMAAEIAVIGIEGAHKPTLVDDLIYGLKQGLSFEKTVQQALDNQPDITARDFHKNVLIGIVQEAFGLDGRVAEEESQDINAAYTDLALFKIATGQMQQHVHLNDGIVAEAEAELVNTKDTGSRDVLFYMATLNIADDLCARIEVLNGNEMSDAQRQAIAGLVIKSSIACGPQFSFEHDEPELEP